MKVNVARVDWREARREMKSEALCRWRPIGGGDSATGGRSWSSISRYSSSIDALFELNLLKLKLKFDLGGC